MPDSINTRFIASALLRRGDAFLFIRQSKPGGAYPDTLHIPGGGVEQGETPLEAVRREVSEEVNVVPTRLEPVDFSWDTVDYKGQQTVLVFLRFTGDVPEDAVPRPSSDAKEIVWIDRHDLTSAAHNPPTLSLLKRLALI